MAGWMQHVLPEVAMQPSLPDPVFGRVPGRAISGGFVESPPRTKNAIKQVLSRYGARYGAPYGAGYGAGYGG